MQDLSGVRHIDAAVAWYQPCGNKKVVGKDDGFVGAAVAVGVFEDHNLVLRFLAWFNMRIGGAGGEPEPACGIPVHLNRLADNRVGGKQVDLESFRNSQ